MTNKPMEESPSTGQDACVDNCDERRKTLSPAAQRALAEAEERRARAKQDTQQKPKEFEGPKGLEPTRYGDWERKGIVSDF